MDVWLKQSIGFSYFARAHWLRRRHFYLSAEGFQPYIGATLIAIAVGWSILSSSHGGIQTIIQALLLAWGMFLLTRLAVIRSIQLFRIARINGTFSYPETWRFFDSGFSRSNPVRTEQFGWECIKEVILSDAGISLLRDDGISMFLDKRAKPIDGYREIESFLSTKFGSKRR